MFTGFSPETFDFLWGLRLNNEKSWFEAHKQDYVNFLYEPMKALGQEVFAGFSHPGLELKVSRIYRDARLHPPVPYKEGLWFSIRFPVQDWARHPTVYFEIRPEGANLGFVLWMPTTAAMESFRQDLLARPGHFPSLCRQAEESSGLTLNAQCYKRPKPCPVPEVEPYFGWRCDLEASTHLDPGPALFGPELVEYLQKTLLPWVPICDYFYTHTA